MIEPPAHLIPLDDPWKGEADHGLVGLLAVQYEFPILDQDRNRDKI